MSTENTITTAEKDFAAAPNATLDELVGTTTNTALLPEPDAHAYDEIATGDADPLILGGHKFTSRFILGSGRYDLNLIKATIENAGTQIVTMRCVAAVPPKTICSITFRRASPCCRTRPAHAMPRKRCVLHVSPAKCARRIS